MNKWIAEFELEDGDTMPEHMDLTYKGIKLDFHCRPLQPCEDFISRQAVLDLAVTIETDDYSGNEIMEVVDINDVKALPPVQPKTEHWIPISERLPDEFTVVLCNTDSEEIFIATYLGKMNDGTDCFDDHDGMMWEGDVVAWMPLPEPYESQESEE